LITVYKEMRYYSEPNFIPNIPEKNIHIYPNPASEYVIFDGRYVSEPIIVELFDNLGRKVLEHNLSENRLILISNLAQGIYLYRVNYGGNISKGKLIVK
jgi:hypothetical protein